MDLVPSSHLVPSRALGRSVRVHVLDALVALVGGRSGYASVAFAVEVGGEDAHAFRIFVRVIDEGGPCPVGSPRWREAAARVGVEHFDRVASEAT